MKKLIFAFLFLISLSSFAQSPIDGEWKGTRETPNGAFEIVYNFKVEGDDLEGLWKTQFGETAIEDGKVDGKNISYRISFNDMTLHNTGELINDDEILIKNDMGEMKLNRVK